MRCVWCGKFVAYADFDQGKALSHFTPDTQFTRESIEVEHMACKERFEPELAARAKARLQEQQ